MAGRRRSGSARSRKRQNSEEGGEEYNLGSCPNCDRADCDDVIPDRALWWIVTLWDGKVLLDNVFDFLGLLWLLKLVWRFAFPPFLVIWMLKCLCRFFSIIELLEENVPLFLFCEYMIPLCAVVGGLLHFFWTVLAPLPACSSISFYMSLRLSWILIYELVARPDPGAEGWWEILAQLAFYTCLLLSTVSSDKKPLRQEDIALIKDFAGCDCSSRRNHSEEDSNSIWAFESQVKEGLLDVLPAFHLLQSGVGFDDLPQHCKMKVLNFLQNEIKDGKKRFEYRSSPVCSGCCSSQGTSSGNKQQIVSESRIKHQALGEISVQVLEVTHHVQESNFDTSFHSSDCCDCDSTDFENGPEAPGERPVLPSTAVNKKSKSSSKESIEAVPEANGDNELENLAKTVTTFELDQVSQSRYSKDVFSNFKFKKNTMTNQTEDVLKPTKIEGSQLSEERAKGYKMEKSGRKKVQDKGGKLCGRKGCEEKGTQLCSRCKSVSYCSVACSETYWPEHRSSCSKEKEKKQMRRRQKEKIATEVD